MDEDWKNAFGILMCMEIYDGAGAGICDGMPSTCSSETTVHTFPRDLFLLHVAHVVKKEY